MKLGAFGAFLSSLVVFEAVCHCSYDYQSLFMLFFFKAASLPVGATVVGVMIQLCKMQ